MKGYIFKGGSCVFTKTGINWNPGVVQQVQQRLLENRVDNVRL